MKRISKKLLSIILSAVMVVTMIPAFTLTSLGKTTTEWQVAASTDFTQSGWSSDGERSGYGKRFTSGWVPTTAVGGQQMSWKAYEWSATSVSANENGVNIKDGFLYLTGSGTGGVPVANSSAFKIDIQFSFNGDYTISSRNSEGPVFIELATNNDMDFNKGDIWSDTFFTQEGYGRSHNQLAYDVKSGREGGEYRISTDNLKKNTQYHYELTYEDGYLSSAVKDDNGHTVINLGGYKGNFDTSAIKSLSIGTANNYYYNNYAIKNVTMYTGTTSKSGSQTYVDADKDKYLFTYFTGNDTNGETLHMAVSDDGMNWEALNGNKPIWDASKLPGTVESYPDNSGVAASGHVRDPYAFQAQDGSYYVLATDLNTENGTNWGNNTKMMVWHLNSMADLANTTPWFIDTNSIIKDAGISDNVSRAWAPEAIWDPEVGHYMLFWSVGYINGHTYMYYSYTDDFKTLLTKPQQLIRTDGDNIDGNITYDGTKYYLWFKNESNSRIGYATSNHASGPYSQETAFYDNLLDTLEGPEIYQLQSGNYILLADYFNSNVSYFGSYMTAETPDKITTENKIKDNRINHLSPRHGSIMNITTEEYNKLVAAYGKSVYDSTGVESGKSVNDYLIARYFTNDDVTYDATLNGHTLTNNGVTIAKNFNGKVAAHFTGTTTDGSSENGYNPNDGMSGDKSGTYAYINTADMLKDIDINKGVTFSWYGYAENANSGRWFDWTTANPGTIVWDGSDANQRNTAYVYSGSNMEFGANNYGAMAIANGYRGLDSKGSWHEYTMSISNGFISFWIDNALLFTSYSSGSVTKQGTPIALPSMNENFIDTIKNDTLNFGISSYQADSMLNGYISDFRVYGRALSAQDIMESNSELENQIPSDALGDAAKVYFDPMEDMDTTGDGVNDKTAYEQTVEDSVHGKVLNIAGGVTSHVSTGVTNPPIGYYGEPTTPSKGYTISAWVNPGSQVTANTSLFCIGNTAVDNIERRYFVLMEDGTFHYVWDESSSNTGTNFIDVGDNVFGTALNPDTWYHVTIQVEPNGNFDNLYFYVNGKLTKKVNYYLEAQRSDFTGKAIHDFFGVNSNVYYGDTPWYWSKSDNGYIDHFSIYNGLYSAEDVYRKDCDVMADKLLDIAIQDYEKKMAALKGTDYVYTNMYDAYIAYDRLSRYKDSFELGDVTAQNGEIVELYDALENALENMKVYRKPDTKNGLSGSETGVANNISEKYTHNMLSTVNLSELTEIEGGTEKYHFSAALSSTKFLWLYTGIENDTPTAPMTLAMRKTSQANVNGQSLESVHFKDDTSNPSVKNGITIPEKWKMTNSNGDEQDWVYENTSGTTNVANHHVTSKHNSDGYFNTNTNNTWFKGSGYIAYTGTLTTSDPYYVTVQPYFVSDRGWTNNIGSGGFSADLPFQYTGDITIINYTHIRSVFTNDKLNDYLANITKYNPESCRELITAYDNLTKLNYNVSGIDGAQELAKTAKEDVDFLLGYDLTKIEKKADGSQLVEEVTNQTPFYEAATQQSNVMTNGSIGAIEENGGAYAPVNDENGNQYAYTTSSWTAYEHAYHNLTDYFTALNPYGADKPYTTSEEQLDKLVINAQKSQHSLQVAADYTKVDEAVAANTDTYNAGIGEGDQQKYAYYLWNDYKNAYDAATVWHNKDEAYRADTEKYNVQYTKELTETLPDGTMTTMTAGPYIAYDADGNIVTDDSQVIDHYTFIGEFYDHAGDAAPSRFETGDYVKIGDEYIQLNGHRYYVDNANSTRDLSVRQKAINDKTDDLNISEAALTAPAEQVDYNAYNHAVALLKYQDMAAFNPDYIESASSPYGVVAANGTMEASVTYQNGVDSTASKECPTPDFVSQEETAYVNVNGTIYKNAAQQASLDESTTKILTGLNLANHSEDAAVRTTHNVIFRENGTEKINRDYYYGDSVQCVPDGKPYKWTVTAGGTTKDLPASATYTVHVQGATVIDVFTNPDDTIPENTVKVQFINFAGEVIDEHRVASDANLTVGSDSCTVDSTEVLPPSMPFYTFSGWTVNGHAVEPNTTKKVSEFIPVDGVLKVKANYSAVQGEMTITFDGEAVENQGFQSGITLNKPADAYAIAYFKDNKIYVVSYDAQYHYYATTSQAFVSVYKNADGSYQTKDGTAVTDAETVRKLNAQLPFTSAVGMSTDTGFATYAAPTVGTLGSDAVITEYGIVFAEDNGTWTDDNFVIGAAGANARPAKLVNESSQYYFNIKTRKKIVTRSYIKYSYTVKGIKIQTIDYGNICRN